MHKNRCKTSGDDRTSAPQAPVRSEGLLSQTSSYSMSSSYLKAELIAGNSQNHKPFIREAFVELVHLGVIPGGRSSKRSDILDQDHLAL